jgi:hypothetical protein
MVPHVVTVQVHLLSSQLPPPLWQKFQGSPSIAMATCPTALLLLNPWGLLRCLSLVPKLWISFCHLKEPSSKFESLDHNPRKLSPTLGVWVPRNKVLGQGHGSTPSSIPGKVA